MSSAFSQRCLICSSWSPKSTSTSFLSGEESDESRVSCMLDRQVSALYLVSGLLEVPGEMCARFLTVYGHPDEWANVCEWCNILVAQGMTLFRQIRRLEAEHAKVRAAVKDRMKVKAEVEGSENDQEAAAIDIRRFLDAIENLETEHKTETQCNQQDENTKNYIGSQAVATVNETPHKRSNKTSTPRRTAKVTKSRLKPIVHPSKTCPDTSMQRKSGHLDVPVIISKNDDTNLGRRTRQSKIRKDECYINAENMSDQETMIEEPSNELDSDWNDDSLNTQDQYYCDSDQSCGYVPSASKKTRRKTQLAASLKAKNFVKPKLPRTRPSLIKDPEQKSRRRGKSHKYETLMFEKVVELQKSYILSLPPLSASSTTEEKEKRRRLLKERTLKQFCLRHQVQKFPCSTCPQVFTKFCDWNAHANITGCEKNSGHTLRKYGPVVVNRINCEECGKPVGNVHVLEDHFRTAHCATPEILNCRGCSLECRKMEDYRKHLRAATPGSDCTKLALKCPHTNECRSAIANSEAALQLHIKIRHSTLRPPTNKCIQCNKAFTSKHTLKKHMDKHSDRNIKCDRPNCTSVFKTNNRLNEHIKQVHESKKEGAAEYRCETCGKVFNVKGRLRRHEKLHNPETPFLCTVCGKGFKIANYLTIHMWSHDPAMKYKYTMYKNNANKAKEKRLQPRKADHPSDQEETRENTDDLSSDKSSDPNNSNHVLEHGNNSIDSGQLASTVDWSFL
ncbi:zinc finger protein 99 [Folsomia candida]|uniref:zinc finger protein 99 n=1 Tax=Folsomia candida TaxID=158441 RepID=UPI000B8FF5C8|nr:zinc finger protein 99 [Folsomia candida]